MKKELSTIQNARIVATGDKGFIHQGQFSDEQWDMVRNMISPDRRYVKTTLTVAEMLKGYQGNRI